MSRRRFLRTLGGAAAFAAAGCVTRDGAETGGNGSDGEEAEDGDLEGTLTVATYDAFLDAPSTSPGAWVKEEFERRHPDATVEWTVPDNGLNRYIEQRTQGVDVDADLYLGLNVDDLIRADRTVEGDLFVTPERDAMENVDALRSELEFDPEERVVPYDTGYISLVYDEDVVDEPGTLDALLEPEYEGALLAQNAQSSDPGQAFLLWTIAAYGEEGYLDYWRRLADNEVRILGSWWDAYSAYLEEERPMIVSYSTDQVYASRDGNDLSRHQVAFPDGEGYANPEGVGILEGTDRRALGEAFIDFLLSPEAQANVARLNVQFPATTHANLDEEFDRYAHEPDEIVSFSYGELYDDLETWVDDWAREIAGR